MLEGWAPDDEWKKVGTVAAAAHNSGITIASVNGRETKASDYRSPQQYYPNYSADPLEQPKATLTAEESEARAKQRWG